MTADRKSFELREKELRLAIHKIQQGRASSKARKLTISAVAREANVTPALIHNHYPTIASLIRAKQGASDRRKREEKDEVLKEERQKNRTLRSELKQRDAQVAKLASINEMLLLKIEALSAEHSVSNVVRFPGKPGSN